MIRATCLSLATSLTLLASPVWAQEARIYPDTLRAETPEDAARHFVDSFAAQDYFAVFYMLTPAAQQDFFKVFQTTFSFETFFVGSEGAIPPGSVMDPDVKDERGILADRSLVFDNLMFHADTAGMLPFSFGPDASIGAVSGGDVTAEITVATDADPAQLTLHVSEDAQGFWRVDRVSWDGANPDIRPWSIPAAH